MLGERTQQPVRVELAREGPGGHAERERTERAVPEAVAPRGGRRAEEAVARADAGAVERGDHQGHDAAVGVPDRRRQFPGSPGGVLEDREIVGPGVRRVAVRVRAERGEERVVGHHRLEPARAAGDVGLRGRDQQEPRRAVVDAQAQAVGAEEGEERHRDGPALHRAEEPRVEGQRRLEHDAHALAGADAALGQEVGEARGPGGEAPEGEDLVPAPVLGRVDDAHRGPLGGVAVDALVADVEALAVAVEELPQTGRGAEPLGVRVGDVVGQRGHRSIVPH